MEGDAAVLGDVHEQFRLLLDGDSVNYRKLTDAQ